MTIYFSKTDITSLSYPSSSDSRYIMMFIFEEARFMLGYYGSGIFQSTSNFTFMVDTVVELRNCAVAATSVLSRRNGFQCSLSGETVAIIGHFLLP